MDTYGRWTEEDLDRVLTALQNGDAGLHAIAKAYGVPKATLKNILTAATNMLMAATLKSAVLISIC